MEITNEIKAKVFAQYLYQKIEVNNNRIQQSWITVCSPGMLIRLNNSKNEYRLILKPLSAISDEDATEFSRILKPNDEYTHNSDYGFSYAKRFFDGTMYTTITALMAFDFLRSAGYDIPHYLLGGKTLHEVGLAIY